MTKICAKNLATGDTVILPRKGRVRLARLIKAGIIGRAFVCDDGKTRHFGAHEEVEAERRTDQDTPRAGDILRLDLESNRVSTISTSLMGFSSEISASFKTFGRVTSFPDSAAREEILCRGATLFTEKAIYWRAH